MAEKEYIERNLLIRKIVTKYFPALPADSISGLFCKSVIDTIYAQPAADVVEVRHGEWIDHKNGNATCSHCRIRQTAVYDDENEQNFCGHCGARMDGGEDDGNL